MNYTKDTFSNYSVAAVSVPKSTQVFVAWTSTDIHEKNSSTSLATALAYREALLSGTKHQSREQFLDAVNSLGATINVDVSDGSVGILLKATTNNAKKLIALYQEMLAQPAFTAKEVDRIKKQQTNNLTEYKEEAKGRSLDELTNQLYGAGDRRYEFTPEQLIKATKSITRKDLQDFHKQVMKTYFVTSLYAPKDLVAVFSKTVSELKHKQPARNAVGIHQPQAPKRKITLLDIPSKQNIEFNLGAPLPLTLHHPDYLPFVFGLSVLGQWGGFAGRLMSTVREKEGLTYGIYASVKSVMGTETGYWRIMTFFSPQQSVQGLRSTMRELTAIHEKGITADEFKRFQTILKTKQVLLNDSAARSIDDLHSFQTAGFSIEEMLEFKERIFSVTRAKVNQALKKYLNPNEIVISGAGPVKSVKAEITKLFA